MVKLITNFGEYTVPITPGFDQMVAYYGACARAGILPKDIILKVVEVKADTTFETLIRQIEGELI